MTLLMLPDEILVQVLVAPLFTDLNVVARVLHGNACQYSTPKCRLGRPPAPLASAHPVTSTPNP